MARLFRSSVLFPVLLLILLFLASCVAPGENGTESQPSSPSQPSQGSLSMSRSTLSGGVALLDGVGTVDFPITTSSEEAQAFFNQGVAELYGFWFSEAERSFREAARLDPGAAMAYWGIAMAAPATFVPMYQRSLDPVRTVPMEVPPNSPNARAREAIGRALALSDSVTMREGLYIEAVAARNDPRLSDPDTAYVAVMRRLVRGFPEDLEAKAVLALALENGYDPLTKLPRDGSAEAVTLLREVLAENPDHVGASHFLIHGLEGSDDLRDALPLADRYASLAPAIPHALHMPGHVYGQVGMFDEAIESFLATAAKELEYVAADPRYSKQHYVHNEFLLLHVLGLQGDYQRAMSRIADLMPTNLDAADGEAALLYRVGWFVLMKTLVRFENWDAILDGETLPVVEQPFEAIWYQWAQGLAYASTSNVRSARDALQSLDQSIEQLGRFVSPIPPQFQIARSELSAYIDAIAGEAGLEGLERAAQAQLEMPYTEPPVYPRPVFELLGRTALQMGDFESAESAYRRALEMEPGGGRALWGLAQALEGLGRTEDAAEMLAEYGRVWRGEALE